MRDLFAMWRSTRMIVLTAVTAGVYAAILIPFKAFPVLIPGVTEFRPGNVVPIVCSLLFGPAGAWGAAFGNLIGDFFGTIGPGSIFGFVGNLLYGYLPYRLWQAVSRRRATGEPLQIPLLLAVVVVSSAACAFVIGFGVDLLQMVPYSVLTPIIFLNNAVVAGVLAPVILPLIYARVKRWGLLYEDVLPEEDTANGTLGPVVGLPTVVIACVVALAIVWALGGQSQIAIAGACVVVLLAGTFLLARWPRPRVPEVEWPEIDAAEGAGMVQVEKLSFTYPDGDRAALTDVGLDLESGKFTALMGRTGAGKSTLCLCLNGLIPHFQRGDFDGRVFVRGRDTRELSPARIAETVGVLFQDFETQLFSTEVQSEVAFALENRAVPREDMVERVAAALRMAGLDGFGGRDPTTLSGGEKQRLALASVLSTRPPFVVLDEPTTDLDPRGQAELLEAVGRLRDDGAGLLVAGHEATEARAADSLVVLDDGGVAYQGDPADLLRDPDRLAAAGVRPLDSIALFALLGRPERPLTPEEAIAALQAAAYEVDREQAARLDDGRPTPGDPLIEVDDVHFSYNGAEALRGVSLTIRQGEFVALLGQNGSGKTTLARHLNALLRPTEGLVRVGGRDAAGCTPADLARTVGYVFQNPDHQIFAPTVREEVSFGPRNIGLSGQEIESSVGEALEAVDLLGYEDEDPFSLTKGERQRVAVASILAQRPALIILDEPTTGLDGPQQRRMMDLLARLNAEGHTVLIITHSMWAAASYAHRVVLLDEGLVLADGPARELFGRPDLLAQASLRAPEIVPIGREFAGETFLTPDEMASCLREGGS